MAVLSKIRQRSFFLIVIIALALFSFVLADVIKSGGFGTNSNNIGSVDGSDIDAKAFMQKAAQVEKQSQQNQQGQPPMSSTQAMNNVWEQEVRSILVGEQIEKLGLGIGSDQLINVIKENPYFSQNPQFVNEAGKFDENKLKEFVKSMNSDPNQDRLNQWKQFEEEIEKSAVEQLYYNMIKGGVYTTKAEAKFKNVLDNKKVDFDYVTIGFATINDDQVKVSDDEIMAFMKKSPKKYKSDETRAIEYVVFENVPSKEDETALETTFYDLVNGKEGTPSFKDIPANEVGAFIAKNNSETPFDSTYVTKKNLPVEFQEQLFNLSTGEVFGPYVNNGYQSLSKMMGKKGNSSAKASHILLSYNEAQSSSSTRTKEEAQALANSLLAQAKVNPDGFGALATANSDDPGSKNNGGEYDNIEPGQMVPTFNDYVFNNPVGSIGVVETDYGFHVIKVMAKYDAVQLATISKKIEPSEKTIDEIYNKASQFETDANDKKFAEVAKAQKLTITPANNIRPSDEYVQGLGAQREVVRWSFNDETSVGDIKRFETPTGYIVAVLNGKNETGLLSMDVARDAVGAIIRNEKKAELIKKKMSGATLEAVAKSSGGSVLSANGVAISSAMIENIGAEPKVVGTAFGLEAGKTSKLIVGNSGVFMIKPKKVTEAPAVTDFSEIIKQEKAQQANSAQTRAYQAIKDKATIKDYRAKF